MKGKDMTRDELRQLVNKRKHGLVMRQLNRPEASFRDEDGFITIGMVLGRIATPSDFERIFQKAIALG